jgi:tripartite-type tricarboxylate transporter receptor subunit TctC
MMEKQPSLVRVGGARPPPFTIFTITYKVALYAPAKRADTNILYLRIKRDSVEDDSGGEDSCRELFVLTAKDTARGMHKIAYYSNVDHEANILGGKTVNVVFKNLPRSLERVGGGRSKASPVRHPHPISQLICANFI